MTDHEDLLRHARDRAAVLRPGYRAAGLWSSAPLDVVRFAAARQPTRVVLLQRGKELTFAELDERIDTACHALVAAGVRRDTPVLLIVGNDIDSVTAIHAVLRVDAVALLVPDNAGTAQIRDIITRTGAVFGIAAAGRSDIALGDDHLITWVDLRRRHQTSAATPHRPTRAADEPSVVLYTSGTTSRPKGVIHSVSTLATAAANYIAAAGLTAADRVLLISPLASVTGVLQALFVAPMLSAATVLEDRWDPSATYDLMAASGATWYGGPDRLLDRLLDQAAQRDHQIPLRAVYLGGTMLDRRIVERAEDEFGIVVMRAYGSSEAPVSTSGLRVEARSVRHGDDGVALNHVDVRLGSRGDPGECCIKGPHMFLGYTDADDDRAAFEGEWFVTGDVAELEDGRVRIVGRIKDIVIRNGLKIAAGEVEEAVGAIPGVRDCAAYSVPDPTTGERLAVALVLAGGTDLSLAEVTAALLAAGLPKYKLPEELVFWDDPLPVNAGGKVLRNQLADAGQGRPRLFADRVAATR